MKWHFNSVSFPFCLCLMERKRELFFVRYCTCTHTHLVKCHNSVEVTKCAQLGMDVLEV